MSEDDRMKQLFVIDLNDYNENDTHFCRPSARGIILKPNGKIALVYSKQKNYYKFPGGGIHVGEDKREALIREVKEEVGMIVKPDTIQEFGSVMRLQKSTDTPNTVFEQENFYYLCQVEEEIQEQNLDAYEMEEGFELRIVALEEAIATNKSCKCEDFFDQVMVEREAKVLDLIREQCAKCESRINADGR